MSVITPVTSDNSGSTIGGILQNRIITFNHSFNINGIGGDCEFPININDAFWLKIKSIRTSFSYLVDTTNVYYTDPLKVGGSFVINIVNAQNSLGLNAYEIPIVQDYSLVTDNIVINGMNIQSINVKIDSSNFIVRRDSVDDILTAGFRVINMTFLFDMYFYSIANFNLRGTEFVYKQQSIENFIKAQ